MSQVKELKGHMIAGPAIKDFQFFIQWHLTERCNLRCRHCYQGTEKVREMTASEIKREIDGATRMFQAWEEEHGITVSPSIHFTGGEPLLYKRLWDVIGYARGRGFRVAVMTNGCLVTKEDAKRAVDLGIDDIQISLEGPPDLHDSIRGKKSFEATARGISKLVGAGNRVSANVTLSRINADQIEKTVDTAREMGCYAIGFSRIVPCGSAKALLDQFLTPQELKTAYRKINSLNCHSFQVLSGDPLSGMLSETEPPVECSLTLSGCSAGFSGVTITSDGSVMPCRRIGLSAGNVKKKSLRDIWASSRLLWSLRRRESYSGRCGRCSRWASCRGCRAVAYAYSSAQRHPDLFADDPQCWVISS